MPQFFLVLVSIILGLPSLSSALPYSANMPVVPSPVALSKTMVLPSPAIDALKHNQNINVEALQEVSKPGDMPLVSGAQVNGSVRPTYVPYPTELPNIDLPVVSTPMVRPTVPARPTQPPRPVESPELPEITIPTPPAIPTPPSIPQPTPQASVVIEQHANYGGYSIGRPMGMENMPLPNNHFACLPGQPCLY